MSKIVQYAFWMAYIGLPIVSGLARDLADEARAGTLWWVLAVSATYAVVGCSFSVVASALNGLLDVQQYKNSISPEFRAGYDSHIQIGVIITDFNSGMRQIYAQSIGFSIVIWTVFLALVFN